MTQKPDFDVNTVNLDGMLDNPPAYVAQTLLGFGPACWSPS